MMCYKTLKQISIITLATYIGSYLLLSIMGNYIVGIWGPSGPKSMIWCPATMGHEKPNCYIWDFYAPIFYLDRQYWHRDQ